MCMLSELIFLFLFNLTYPFFNWLMYKLSIFSKNKYYHNIKYIITKNGPVFIKYTQLLLIRKKHLLTHNKKIFDMELINILSKLENDIYIPKNKDYITINNKKIKIKDSYSISSGSVAYIYEIYYNDQICILKATHENIRTKIKNNIKLLKCYLFIFSCINKLKVIIKSIKLDQFENLLLKQTDMKYESDNLQLFYNIFLPYEMVHIPKYIDHDQNNLIMTKEKGIKLYPFLDLNPNLNYEVVYLLYSSIHKMVSEGIIHGDFHQGNFLFYESDNKVHLTILDFGLIFKLTPEQSDIILNYLESYQNKYLVQLINTYGNHIDEKIDIKNIPKNDCKNPSLEKKTGNINRFIINYNVELPMEIYNFISTIDFLKNLCNNIELNRKKFSEQLSDYMIDNKFI
mgnify:CR=1 FL=1